LSKYGGFRKKIPHTFVQKEFFPLYELHWIELFLVSQVVEICQKGKKC
jgi:hypothetical protein